MKDNAKTILKLRDFIVSIITLHDRLFYLKNNLRHDGTLLTPKTGVDNGEESEKITECISRHLTNRK